MEGGMVYIACTNTTFVLAVCVDGDIRSRLDRGTRLSHRESRIGFAAVHPQNRHYNNQPSPVYNSSPAFHPSSYQK